MTIANLAEAQNAVLSAGTQQQSFTPPTGQPAQRGRGQAYQSLRKDIDGYDGIGTYGVEFKPGEAEDEIIAEFNTSVARRGRYSDAYPIRQVPELFGLTREAFEAAATLAMLLIIERFGEKSEDSGLTNVNWQPYTPGVNVNYEERLHVCVPVAPNKVVVFAGLFEPRVDLDPMNPSPDWIRNQYMLRLGTKQRCRNVIERVETGQMLTLKNGQHLPLTLLIDKQEAAPRATFKGIKMAKMAGNSSVPTTQMSAVVLQSAAAAATPIKEGSADTE